MHKALRITMLTLAALTLAVTANADQITDQVQSGIKLYEDGKISQAINEIDFALGQMRQKQAEAIAAILPEKVEGWVAKKAKSSGNQAVLGAGSIASRSYNQDGGNGKVKIEILRLGQGMGAMFNPMMLQRMGGGKPVLIGGMKGTLMEKGENEADLVLTIAAEHILKIEVKRTEDPDEVADDFANTLDLAKLKELLR